MIDFTRVRRYVENITPPGIGGALYRYSGTVDAAGQPYGFGRIGNVNQGWFGDTFFEGCLACRRGYFREFRDDSIITAVYNKN